MPRSQRALYSHKVDLWSQKTNVEKLEESANDDKVSIKNVWNRNMTARSNSGKTRCLQ